MSRAFRQFVRNWRGDGGIATALLFVVLAIAGAGLTLLATDEFLHTRDTLLRYAPANAVAYVHASRMHAAGALLSTLQDVPAGLRPYEAAVFMMPGDDKPRRGVVVGWRNVFGPTSMEIASLEAAGAVKLDGRRYLIGDADVAAWARVSNAAGNALADRNDVAMALGLMRRSALVQAYVLPRSVYGALDAATGLATDVAGAADDANASAAATATSAALPAAPGAPEDVATALLPEAAMLNATSPEPLVLGIHLRGDAFAGRVMTMSELLSAPAPAAATDAIAPAPRLPTLTGIVADIGLSEATPSFDVMSLLPMIDVANGQTPMAHQAIAEAEGVVRKTLAAPYALWLRNSRQGSVPPFLLHFPSVPVADVEAAFHQLYAAYHPARRILTLPDGEKVVELTVATDLSGAIIARDGEDAVIDAAVPLIVGRDGAGGSFISNAKPLVGAMRARSAGAITDVSCPTGAATLRLTPFMSSKIPLLQPFMRNTNGSSIVITKAVGKGVYVCGYFN